MEVQSVGRVPNRVQLLIPLQTPSTLLHQMLQKRLFVYKESQSHQKSKHIERRYHIIRDIVGRGDIAMQKIASAKNPADPFTKAMS